MLYENLFESVSVSSAEKVGCKSVWSAGCGKPCWPLDRVRGSGFLIFLKTKSETCFFRSRGGTIVTGKQYRALIVLAFLLLRWNKSYHNISMEKCCSFSKSISLKSYSLYTTSVSQNSIIIAFLSWGVRGWFHGDQQASWHWRKGHRWNCGRANAVSFDPDVGELRYEPCLTGTK